MRKSGSKISGSDHAASFRSKQRTWVRCGLTWPAGVIYNLVMKSFYLVLLILLLFVAAPAKSKKKTTEASKLEFEQGYEQLDAKYKNWLDMIAYIATSEEKRVFLKLQSDRDRDAFIRIFWQQRDPTPGTPENEFYDEVARRFDYVNSVFYRGSVKPGWKTDQGRIYMILGKPVSINRLEEKAGLVPVQIWDFYGDSRLGLPANFSLVFFKRSGSGEYKLYNPLIDGPAALLIDHMDMDLNDYSAVYNKIYELAPVLAGPAISIIPNEQNTVNYMPSQRNAFVMASIIQSPVKHINVSYATNFLKYKGMVDIESSINFIEASNTMALVRDDRFDYNFLTFSVKPKKISLGYSQDKDQYFFNFTLNVSLRQKDKILYQYSKNYDFYYDPDKVNSLQNSGLVIHDSFPVAPGKYEVVVYMENSVGKEFSYFDKSITVPTESAVPVLATPVLGYGRDEVNDNFFYPYKFVNQKLRLNPEEIFNIGELPYMLVGIYNVDDKLWRAGRVEWSLKGLSERVKFHQEGKILLQEYPQRRNMNIIYQIPTPRLAADYYELTLRLFSASGIPLDTRSNTFSVSPVLVNNHPLETYKQLRVDNPYLFEYVLGTQYEGSAALPQAEAHYARSVQFNAEFAAGWLAWLNLENRLGKYDRVLADVDKIKGNDKLTFDYHMIKGMALYGQEQYGPALEELLQANKVYNSDTRVINLLGFTFQKLNEPDEARKAFEASLKLNAQQPAIDKALVEVRKEIEKRAVEKH